MTQSSSLPDPIHQSEFYSGIPAKRLFAWIIDVILVTLLTFLIGVLTLGIGLLFFVVFYVVIDFLYRWFTMSAGSATLGMRMMAIEIRNGFGERLNAGEAALHTLGFMISAGFFLPQMASIAMMLFGPAHKGLHDVILGTAAINRPG